MAPAILLPELIYHFNHSIFRKFNQSEDNCFRKPSFLFKHSLTSHLKIQTFFLRPIHNLLHTQDHNWGDCRNSVSVSYPCLQEILFYIIYSCNPEFNTNFGRYLNKRTTACQSSTLTRHQKFPHASLLLYYAALQEIRITNLPDTQKDRCTTSTRRCTFLFHNNIIKNIVHAPSSFEMLISLIICMHLHA